MTEITITTEQIETLKKQIRKELDTLRELLDKVNDVTYELNFDVTTMQDITDVAVDKITKGDDK